MLHVGVGAGDGLGADACAGIGGIVGRRWRCFHFLAYPYVAAKQSVFTVVHYCRETLAFEVSMWCNVLYVTMRPLFLVYVRPSGKMLQPKHGIPSQDIAVT